MQSEKVYEPYLDSIDLMQLGKDATIGHIGLFRMILVYLVFLVMKLGHSPQLYPFCPVLGGEPCLAM